MDSGFDAIDADKLEGEVFFFISFLDLFEAMGVCFFYLFLDFGHGFFMICVVMMLSD